MSNPRFSVFAFRPLANARVTEVDVFDSVQWTNALAGQGAGSLSVPWWSTAAAQIVPNSTAIAIDDGGQLRWAGMVTARRINPEELGESVQFGLRSFWWYYTRRWVRSILGMSYAETANVGPYDVKWIAKDQFRMVTDVIAHAASVAGDANLGLTPRMFGPGGGGLSGVNRTRTIYGYERKRIAQLVEELAAQQGGFDFVATCEWNKGTSPWTVDRYLDLHYPRRGNASTAVVLEHGTNVTVLNLVDDGERMANPAVAVGAGTGDAAITSERIASSYLYPAGPYPFMEGEVQYRDEGVEYSGNLDRLADALLAIGRQPLRTATVALTEQPKGLRLGAIGIGDSPRHIAEFGAFRFDERLRAVTERVVVTPSELTSWEINLADEGATLAVV